MASRSPISPIGRESTTSRFARRMERARCAVSRWARHDAFYDSLTWSPDSRKVFFEDQKLNLWYVDTTAAHPEAVKVATDDYAELHNFDASWSGDSRW